MAGRAEGESFHPGRAPITAYGSGGFRFSGMSHRGSLLILPDGIYGWRPERLEDLRPADFARLFAERAAVSFFLLGTGAAIARPAAGIRAAFAEAGVALDFMDTGAAVRTYNVLLAEDRQVAAGFIAVENAV